MAIGRTAIVDDDGSRTTGTIWNNAWKTELYDQIDAADTAMGGTAKPRVTGTTSSATPTPNADTTDLYSLTAQAAAAAFANPTGTPVNAQQLLVRIKDNGTARALTWGTAYVEGGIALPATTVLSKILTITFRYNTDNALNKWQCLAVAQESATAATGGGSPSMPGGRLTLTSGVPVTTADVTGATTIYYTPYLHDSIELWNGAAWVATTFTEQSIALGADASGNCYDVFGFLNAGVLNIERLAWTNATTRATGISLVNGRRYKTGDQTRRLLATYYTTGAGTTEDSAAKRLVANLYNDVPRVFLKQEATASWTYATATWRQANAAAANQIELVSCLGERPVWLNLVAAAGNAGAPVVGVSIGENSTTTPSTSVVGGGGSVNGFTTILSASLSKLPAVGRSFYAWLEYTGAVGTTTFYGNAGLVPNTKSGLAGHILG